MTRFSVGNSNDEVIPGGFDVAVTWRWKVTQKLLLPKVKLRRIEKERKKARSVFFYDR